MPRVDDPAPGGKRPTAPIPPGTAPDGAPGGPPLKPGRADWYSFSRPDHARLAAEDRRFFADAIRRVRAARERREDASQTGGKARVLAVRPQNQFEGGDRNACGTTSLASILDFWSPGGPLSRRQEIDRAIRRSDLFTAPDELVRFARSSGYRAGLQTGASLDDIRRLLDQGVPVQVLVDPDADGSDITLHYVAVTGYRTDAAGRLTGLTITDPGGGEVYEEDADHFLRRWSRQKLFGFDTGLDRLLIAYVPEGDRPVKGMDGQVRRASEVDLPGNGLPGEVFSDSQGARTFARGISNAMNGSRNRNPVRAVGGGFQVLAGVPGLLAGAAGRYARNGGAAAFDWAERRWREGGPGGKLAGALGFAGGAIAQGFGWALSKAGNAESWAAGLIGDQIGRGGDALNRAAGAVGKGLARAFRGW